MKVIYIKEPNDGTVYKLTKDKEYIVVGMDYADYRILDDDNEPILYPKECFQVTDSLIPDDWIRRDYPDDEFHIDPPECASPGFYEDYFDGSAEAIKIFNDMLKRLAQVDDLQ